ncbi:MAG TPA: hypothetical protein VFI99_06070 [Nocardioides sp.]|jgi:hypothetical protein|nr:hypothetical protein [Nocardioides sp.]
MLLVPRQLRRSGMTGSVPYYGGRFTPAQAWAASHPSGPPPRPRPDSRDTEEALRRLRESGVLTAEEYGELRARVRR